MIRLAFRNLFQNKARLIISVGGVALALLLILSLDAIFTGVERQVTAYINYSGADVMCRPVGCAQYAHGFFIVTRFRSQGK